MGDTVRTLPMAHFRDNLDAASVPGRPTAQLGPLSSDALPQSGAYPVWAQIVGDWRRFVSAIVLRVTLWRPVQEPLSVPDL